MIAIVDSGSTKSEWAFVGKETIFAHADGINTATQTEQSFGFNPSFPKELLTQVEKIYFYGAGLNSEHSKNNIKIILQNIGVVGDIEAMSDLLGAARACCGNDPGLVGILGTGSNICRYNGHNFYQKSPALGYVLGDEGSGFQIGKTILQSYFYGTMPDEIKILFEKNYEITLDTVLLNTYKKPGNNAYIASFTQFLKETGPIWTHTIIKPVFKEFIEKKVLPYTNIERLPLSFVGSVAFVFQDILLEMLNEYSLTTGNILQKPLEKLVVYHSQYL